MCYFVSEAIHVQQEVNKTGSDMKHVPGYILKTLEGQYIQNGADLQFTLVRRWSIYR